MSSPATPANDATMTLSSTMQQFRAGAYDSESDRGSLYSESVYSVDETDPQPKRATIYNGVDANGFVELEAAVANSIYQCVQLIRQRYTVTESHSHEETEEFDQLFDTKANLLDLFHRSEEMVHRAIFSRSAAALASAKALHGEEHALLREFHALHHLVWEGHFMQEGELDELEDLLEQDLPWLTVLRQQGRLHGLQDEGDHHGGRMCRQPDDYLQITLKILKLRLYLKSKLHDLQAHAPNSNQIESAQKSQGNNKAILEELQRSFHLLATKYTLLKPIIGGYATSEGACNDEFCRRQQESLLELTERLQPRYETAAKDAAEIHKLREALVTMRKDRDSVIAQKSLSLPSPPEDTNVRTSHPEGDVAQSLGRYYSPAPPEPNRHSEHTTARQEIMREKELLDESKKQQTEQLAELEARLAKFEAEKLALETRERTVKADEERLRELASAKAAQITNLDRLALETPERKLKAEEKRLRELASPKDAQIATFEKQGSTTPEIQTGAKTPSRIDLLKKTFEQGTQSSSPTIPGTSGFPGRLKDRNFTAPVRHRRKSSIPRPISQIYHRIPQEIKEENEHGDALTPPSSADPIVTPTNAPEKGLPIKGKSESVNVLASPSSVEPTVTPADVSRKDSRVKEENGSSSVVALPNSAEPTVALVDVSRIELPVKEGVEQADAPSPLSSAEILATPAPENGLGDGLRSSESVPAVGTLVRDYFSRQSLASDRTSILSLPYAGDNGPVNISGSSNQGISRVGTSDLPKSGTTGGLRPFLLGRDGPKSENMFPPPEGVGRQGARNPLPYSGQDEHIRMTEASSLAARAIPSYPPGRFMRGTESSFPTLATQRPAPESAEFERTVRRVSGPRLPYPVQDRPTDEPEAPRLDFPAFPRLKGSGTPTRVMSRGRHPRASPLFAAQNPHGYVTMRGSPSPVKEDAPDPGPTQDDTAGNQRQPYPTSSRKKSAEMQSDELHLSAIGVQALNRPNPGGSTQYDSAGPSPGHVLPYPVYVSDINVDSLMRTGQSNRAEKTQERDSTIDVGQEYHSFLRKVSESQKVADMEMRKDSSTTEDLPPMITESEQRGETVEPPGMWSRIKGKWSKKHAAKG